MDDAYELYREASVVGDVEDRIESEQHYEAELRRERARSRFPELWAVNPTQAILCLVLSDACHETAGILLGLKRTN